jgi:hypothetical protein
MTGVRFGATPAALDGTAGVIAAAALAIAELRDHPGVLRGRAADAGDDEVRAALVSFASAWDWGLELVQHETDRWADLLRAVADTYRSLERSVVHGWAP